MNQKQIDAIFETASWYEQHVGKLPNEAIGAITTACKTLAFYSRKLSQLTRDLYNGKITQNAFVDEMADLVQNQLERAWREGMRNNGLDPEKDMTDEWEQLLQELIAEEYNHVDAFAQAIVDGAAVAPPEDPQVNLNGLLSRAELWVNRYTEVVNYCMVVTRPDDRFKWVYGDTEHCGTCEALNGIVATGKQWQESGYQPQNPPNDKLECGGWKCQCRFEYTEEPLTEGGIPSV